MRASPSRCRTTAAPPTAATISPIRRPTRSRSNVVSVNDAPAGTNKTVTTNEDTAYTFATADFGFTDPNDTPANALAAVKITTLPAAGSLKLDGVAVAAGQFVAAADIAAGKLKFSPAANGNGHRLRELHLPGPGQRWHRQRRRRSRPSTANTITVDVVAVNDAPSGADKTVTTNEDTAYTFAAADFGFSDPNDSPANTPAASRSRLWRRSRRRRCRRWAAEARRGRGRGQIVAAADIAAGKLKFFPAANGNGAGYASFTFQVQDNGGTANGGDDLDRRRPTRSPSTSSRSMMRRRAPTRR